VQSSKVRRRGAAVAAALVLACIGGLVGLSGGKAAAETWTGHEGVLHGTQALWYGWVDANTSVYAEVSGSTANAAGDQWTLAVVCYDAAHGSQPYTLGSATGRTSDISARIDEVVQDGPTYCLLTLAGNGTPGNWIWNITHARVYLTAVGPPQPSNTPGPTLDWSPPPFPSDGCAGVSCPSEAPTASYTAACVQTDIWSRCTDTLAGSLTAGHLVAVTFHVNQYDTYSVAWEAWGQAPLCLSRYWSGANCFFLADADRQSDVATVDQAGNPDNPTKAAAMLCGDLSATTHDGTCGNDAAWAWVGAGRYWAVVRNMGSGNPFPGSILSGYFGSQGGDGLPASFYVTVDDYGPWGGVLPPIPGGSPGATAVPTQDGGGGGDGGQACWVGDQYYEICPIATPTPHGTGTGQWGAGPTLPPSTGQCALAPLSQQCKIGILPMPANPTCDFPGLSLDIGQYFNYLGCQLGFVVTGITSSIYGLFNILIDLVVPTTNGLGDQLSGFVTIVGTKVPFSYLAQAIAWINHLMSSTQSAGELPHVMIGGVDMGAKIGDGLGAVAPYRGTLQAAVWLIVAIGVARAVMALAGVKPGSGGEE